MVQGQPMNLNVEQKSNRSHWSNAARGTIISVLERAHTQDRTMSSTADSNSNTQTLDVTLTSLAQRVDPNRKCETYLELKTVESTNSTSDTVLNKPIATDLVIEDCEATLINQLKQDDQKE